MKTTFKNKPSDPSMQTFSGRSAAKKELRNLLYVDDEPGNLVVFRAAFQNQYNVLEASSADQALDLLKSHSVSVMVADQRMPDMTGVELCEIVARDYPHTIRMILTGYADSDSMIDAINKGHVYNFVTKPWEKKVLQSILRRGFETYDLTIANHALLERVQHADRCAELGSMAAGVAHEMRNQLFILPLVELLEQKYPDDAELLELAGVARTTHNRLSGLVNEIMDFVRFDEKVAEPITVNAANLVRETMALAAFDPVLNRHNLKLDVAAEPTIQCHKSKLQQVLFNLLRNAADAVSSRDQPSIQAAVAQEGEDATLSVRDNGVGIEPDVLEKIWEPFFSTKGRSGNGLGLDISRRIIEDHSGTIKCESRVGEGTCFTIRLPAAHRP